MCGEHTYTADDVVHSKGSSPHVRGAPVGWFRVRVPEGIIPACAGSTKHTYASIPYNGDHPRMCGEHGNVNVYHA